MQRTALALALCALSTFAAAQQVCTVTYSTECQTAAGYDCGSGSQTVPALPIADVLDNAVKFKRVIDTASKQQEQKGGTYTISMAEVRTCDAGTSPIRAQGVEVRGVTLAGSTLIADTALQAATEINAKYKAKAKKGDLVGWDHAKALKVERDDQGKRKPPKK